MIAKEGININISFLNKDKAFILSYINSEITIANKLIKYSYEEEHVFQKLKIKVKKEILTTRNNKIDPTKITGEYVDPKEWDNIINNEQTTLIDVRNNYEVEIGTFNNSVSPNANNFSEIISWLDKNIIPIIKKYPDKNIAMFCTGGIRCEKATAYIKSNGAKKVFQLKGGILNYLENNESGISWNGECFVFDNRVTLKNNLQRGQYDVCHACRMPLSKKDLLKKEYIKGISCHKCFQTKTIEQLNRYKERMKQIELTRKKHCN